MPRSASQLGEILDQHAGKAFALHDCELDRATAGPLWLRNPRVAGLVAEALQKGTEFQFYDLLAWVVMPNHVHVVWKTLRPLPEITRWLKGSTARAANLVLGRTGKPFWQYESYDHCIRSDAALARVVRYTEQNPVAAGLVRAPGDWPWSSAAQSLTGPKAYSTESLDEPIANKM